MLICSVDKPKTSKVKKSVSTATYYFNTSGPQVVYKGQQKQPRPAAQGEQWKQNIGGKVDKTDEDVARIFELIEAIMVKSHRESAKLFLDSYLIPLMIRLLRNDCIENIKLRSRVYIPLFNLLSTMAKQGQASIFFSRADELNSPTLKRRRTDLDISASIYELVEVVSKQASIYLNFAKGAVGTSNNDLALQTVCVAIVNALEDLNEGRKGIRVRNTSTAPPFDLVMKPFSFLYIPLTSGKDFHPANYIFANEVNRIVADHGRTLHIARELASLSTSIPCNNEASIFVRVDEDRNDVIKILMSGPIGTPYANGLYEFDILLPGDYPRVPPKVTFRTTDKSRVRFNPNLYNCGKVCLSLLGTWSGDPWIPNVSTILQVLISIQALILVDRPYFNEPGYGAPCDNPRSNAYSANIRKECMTVAILKMIQNPPFAFLDVVHSYFRLKRDEILAQIEEWCVKDNNATRTIVEQLKTELSKL